MKRVTRLTFALAFSCVTHVFAAGDEKNGHAYFTKAELPDMTKILPPFPEFESARFVADQSQHLWGKLMRQDEARAAQAQNDAVYSMLTTNMDTEHYRPGDDFFMYCNGSYWNSAALGRTVAWPGI